MNTFCRWIDTVNDRIGRVVWILFIPLTLITALEVVMRYFFSKPTVWGWDVLVQLMAVVAALGAGYTLLNKGHVRVDVLWERFPLRVRAALDLVTSLLFFFGVGVFFWLSYGEAASSISSKERMSTLWTPPIYPVRTIIAIGVALLILQGIVKFIRDVQTLKTGKEATA